MKILKWILISLIYLNLLFIVFGFSEKKTFCEGFEQGWKDGYCQEDLFCIEPISPICPIPTVGLDQYRHGYSKGFKAGKKKKND